MGVKTTRTRTQKIPNQLMARNHVKNKNFLAVLVFSCIVNVEFKELILKSPPEIAAEQQKRSELGHLICCSVFL
jgi:hypothetical protein